MMTRAITIALVLASSAVANADITMMDHQPVGHTDIVVEPGQPAPQPAPVIVQQPAPIVETDQSDVEYDAMNAAVFASGAVLFGGSYLASVITAGSTSHPGANRLYVPVAGPWLALADWGNCNVSNPSCDSNTTDKVLLIADGIVQAAGVLTMIDGLIWPSEHHRTVVADTKVHFAPTGTGGMVFGHF
jgi:hypothetical protein